MTLKNRRRFLQSLSSLPLLGSLPGFNSAFGASTKRDYFKEMNLRPFINAGEPYTKTSRTDAAQGVVPCRATPEIGSDVG